MREGWAGPDGVITKVIPPTCPPWEAAMDSNLTDQPQGPAQGTVHGEGPSPTPSTGEAGKGVWRGLQGGIPCESYETSDKSLHLSGPIFASRI